MTKWAIYKGPVGLYSMMYIDTLDGCKNLLGGYLITEDRLPIVVNRAGGRCSFDPTESNFVEIIETEDDKEPLTLEQRYPKNSDKFRFGWIAPNGDTYATTFQDHFITAAAICDEFYGIVSDPEQKLEEAGWIKIGVSFLDPDTHIMAVKHSMTKAQADTLVSLGYSNNEDFLRLLKYNEERW